MDADRLEADSISAVDRLRAPARDRVHRSDRASSIELHQATDCLVESDRWALVAAILLDGPDPPLLPSAADGVTPKPRELKQSETCRIRRRPEGA